jgi:hypothetical protein
MINLTFNQHVKTEQEIIFCERIFLELKIGIVFEILKNNTFHSGIVSQCVNYDLYDQRIFKTMEMNNIQLNVTMTDFY